MTETTTAAPSVSSSSTGQGIERAMTILKAVAERSRSGARLTDIALDTGLSKSTVHRSLGILATEGLIESDEKTGKIYLGYELCILGAAAANRFGLVDISRATLESLEELTEDTIYLSVRSGNEALCVDRVVGRFPIKVLTLDVGDRRPLGVGAGSLALLAALGDDDVRQAIDANAAALATWPGYGADQLHQLVATSRSDGYAFNDGRIISGMCAMAAAIYDSARAPLAALTIAATTERMQGERRAQLAQWLTEAAARIGDRVGLLNGTRSRVPTRLQAHRADP